MRAENNLIALLVAIRDFLGGIKDVHIESFLADWPSANCITRSVLPHGLPVLSWLPAAVKAAGKNTEIIVKMLASLANHIAWGQTYSAQDFGVGFLEKYGWTELIGLRGPIASDRIACGFLFLGPQIEYPRHRHEAEEVYVPLTGADALAAEQSRLGLSRSWPANISCPPDAACDANGDRAAACALSLARG